MPDPCICEKKECDLLELLEQKFSQQEALIRELLDRPIAEGPAFPKGHGLSQRWRPRALGSTSTSDEAESKETVSRQGSKESKEEAQKVIEEAFVTERDDEGPELTPANRKKKRNTVLAAVMTEKWAPEPPFRAFVRTRLDAYMGIVVMLNIFVMIVMTQWSGRNSEVKLGLAPEGWPWFTQQFFDLTEYCFYVFYLADVVLRVFVLRREWYFDPVEGFMWLNVFDAGLVFISTMELLILPALLSGGAAELQTNTIRVLKLIRIVRTLRIIKTVSLFRQLRLLVGTCVASIGALFWSMVLLLVLKVAFALMICQALQTFIQDDDADVDTRLEMNQLYGSFLRSVYSMFEITHSGSWPALVRPVLEKVDPWYAILFLPYIALVVFAVIRVVTALFIKETLASAANDAEMVMDETRRLAVEYQEKLEELFCLVDDDGDGHLSAEEFLAAMSLPSVEQYLRFLDVSIRDCRPLFDILTEGDGLITITEFCKGLMQLKGQARALDIVVLQHENSKLMSECREIHHSLQHIAQRLPPAA